MNLYDELVAMKACSLGAKEGVRLAQEYLHPPLALSLQGVRLWLANATESQLDALREDADDEENAWIRCISGEIDPRLEERGECTVVTGYDIPYPARYQLEGPVWRIDVPNVADPFGQDDSVRDSNRRVLEGSLVCTGQDCCYIDLYSRGSVFMTAECPDVVTVLDSVAALIEYPLLDESDHSELESERASEAWIDWGARDWAQEVAVHVSDSDELREFCADHAVELHAELAPDLTDISECCYQFDTAFERSEVACAVRTIRRNMRWGERFMWNRKARVAYDIADHWRQWGPNRPLPEYVLAFIPAVLS